MGSSQLVSKLLLGKDQGHLPPSYLLTEHLLSEWMQPKHSYFIGSRLQKDEWAKCVRG